MKSAHKIYEHAYGHVMEYIDTYTKSSTKVNPIRKKLTFLAQLAPVHICKCHERDLDNPTKHGVWGSFAAIGGVDMTPLQK